MNNISIDTNTFTFLTFIFKRNNYSQNLRLSPTEAQKDTEFIFFSPPI